MWQLVKKWAGWSTTASVSPVRMHKRFEGSKIVAGVSWQQNQWWRWRHISYDYKEVQGEKPYRSRFSDTPRTNGNMSGLKRASAIVTIKGSEGLGALDLLSKVQVQALIAKPPLPPLLHPFTSLTLSLTCMSDITQPWPEGQHLSTITANLSFLRNVRVRNKT